jgi:hypothetical protein
MEKGDARAHASASSLPKQGNDMQQNNPSQPILKSQGPSMNEEEAAFVDESSASSHRSGKSLLERIQAQRNREQQAAASTPQQIQVPQYTPVSQNGNYIDGGGSPDAQIGSNFFSNAWSNISDSMEFRVSSIGGSGTETDLEARDALLSPTSQHDAAEDYSMGNYFMTFVADMYGLFQALPVPARWFFCLILLYIAIKLL